MDSLKYHLGVMCIYDLLKLDSNYCLIMYKKIKFLTPDFLSDLLESTVAIMYDSHLLSENAINNIHLLYKEIYKDYIDKNNPKKEAYINKGYYKVKEYLKKVKIDKQNKLLFDDIKKRYFGINNSFAEILNRTNIENFYIQNYDSIMEDIIYDIYVFEYLLGYNIDTNILIDDRFINSIMYLELCNFEFLKNKNIKMKVEDILIKIEEISDNKKKIKKLMKGIKNELR